MKNILALIIYISLLPIAANAQTWLWAKTTENTPWAGTTKVITNIDGNVYCYGGFLDSMVLENSTYHGWAAMPGGNGFVAKYNTDGAFIKLARVTKSDLQSGFSVQSLNHDMLGNIYLTGDMGGSNLFDTIQLTAPSGYTSGYMAKFNSDLNALKIKSVSDLVISSTFDQQNNIFLTGQVIKPVSYIDTFTFTNPNSPQSYNWPMFVAKLNDTGMCQWVKQSYGGRCGGRGMLKQSSLYLTGRVDSCSMYDTTHICPPSAGTNFVFKTDIEGRIVKSLTYSMFGFAPQGISTSFDGIGNMYVFGTIDSAILLNGQLIKRPVDSQNSAFLAKFDTDFNMIWFKEITCTNSVVGRSITNSQGLTYITGNFSGSIVLGNETYTAQTNADMYVTRFNSNGDCLGTITVANAKLYDLVEDAQGNAIVTGDIYTGTTFFGSTPLTVTGTQSFFLAKLSAITGGTPVQRIAEDNNLNIYPNPNNKTFTIEVPQSLVQSSTAQLGIYDNSGRAVKEEATDISNNKVSVDIGTVNKGIYTVILSSGHKKFTGRVVVE